MLNTNQIDQGLTAFQERIYTYYRAYGRTFPWRETHDPYRILVSEFMLQQTQTARVLAKYAPFVQAFPSFQSLAEAPLKDVLALWQGLGYNRRALTLKAASAIVTEAYAGRLPAELEKLLALPGIGRSTAGAVLAFAFQVPVAFIETNIRRVYIHGFFPGREKVADAEILPLIEATLNRDDPRTFYYALMDYGVMLKEHSVNPNRQSAHYQRQSRFEGSRRQARGRILKALLACPALSLKELSALVEVDRALLADIAEDLVSEGFLKRRGHRYGLV